MIDVADVTNFQKLSEEETVQKYGTRGGNLVEITINDDTIYLFSFERKANCMKFKQAMDRLVVTHPGNASSKCAGVSEPNGDKIEYSKDVAFNVPNNNQGILPLNIFNSV